MGQITAFGPQACKTDIAGHALQLGDRISWAVVANCGHCFYCERHLPQKCVAGVKYGHQALAAGRELSGGLAEYCLLVSGTKIVRWNADVPLAVACPAGCATATAMAALKLAGELKDASLVIMGAGLLGLTACAIAAVGGAQHVICVDPEKDRRALATQFGATQALSPELWPTWCKENLPHGVDIAIEMSGSNRAFEAIWPTMRTGGSVILIGSVFPGEPVGMALEQVVRRCLRIEGMHNYAPEHLHAAVEFLSEHYRQFPFERVVQHWFPLSEIESALLAAQDKQAIRIGVRISP